MIVAGRSIAEIVYAETKERILSLPHAPRLTILTCAPNFETKKYLALKEKKAAQVGISVRVIEMDIQSTTEDFIRTLETEKEGSEGLIVQLPLPAHIDTELVLRAIPTSHDIDALNPSTDHISSPVVGAIERILIHHSIPVVDSLVTVIGSGRLVGRPAYAWFTSHGAHVSLVTEDTVGIDTYTKNADIIVCGVGSPGLLKPEMVKEGVVILDAGTSEDGGELRGDADPGCAEKAKLFTPVPGGIGPLTIAILLKNVVFCAERRASML